MTEVTSNSGAGTGAHWLAAQRWTSQGYDVRPAPRDGQEHPINQICPACSEHPT